MAKAGAGGWSRVYLLVVCLLLLGACSSTTFVYNRLDFLVPWYVDDYVDLDASQKQHLDGLLEPFLVWHRSRELPDYLTILDSFESDLDQPQTPEMIAAVFDEFESAWLRLEGESLDWLLALGAQLSDAQIAELLDELWERQNEYEEEYLERTDEEFYEDSYDDALDNAREYLGSLSDEQEGILLEFSRSLQRSDRAWLAARAQWLEKLGVLLERKPQWQLRVREAVVLQRENPAPEYRRIYEHNLTQIYEVIAVILDGRSEQQDKYLRERLSSLQEDLQELIAEGGSPDAPAADISQPPDSPVDDPAG
ncbi:Uncharacterised protein [Halioglobus japonicus]|nr:Uncharacterised protein [Halioglobus japonicus]